MSDNEVFGEEHENDSEEDEEQDWQFVFEKHVIEFKKNFKFFDGLKSPTIELKLLKLKMWFLDPKFHIKGFRGRR